MRIEFRLFDFWICLVEFCVKKGCCYVKSRKLSGISGSANYQKFFDTIFKDKAFGLVRKFCLALKITRTDVFRRLPSRLHYNNNKNTCA